MKLKEKLQSQIPEMRERVRSLVKEHGDVKVGDINVKQIYGGMRGVKALVSDISFVDPYNGIRLRGHTIPELLELLPKWQESDEMPMVGGMLWKAVRRVKPSVARVRAAKRPYVIVCA